MKKKIRKCSIFWRSSRKCTKKAKEALADPDWQEATKNDFGSLEENKIWDLIRSKEEKPIGSRGHFDFVVRT